MQVRVKEEIGSLIKMGNTIYEISGAGDLRGKIIEVIA